MKNALLCVLLTLVCCGPLAAEEGAKSFSGQWKNYKFKTSGPLSCSASPKGDDAWQGRFQGTFMGDPFDYTVTFASMTKGNQTNLQGTAELDGDRYQWTGYMKGDTLYGKFRSQKGYFGEFVLKEDG
ncbi:MAG: hypothetical protein RIC55_33755 [Pirellulaceae bacterium]